MLKKSKSKIKFERWMRIECAASKDCAWTFMPEKDLPHSIMCVVCGGKTNIKNLLKEGEEVRRRGNGKGPEPDGVRLAESDRMGKRRKKTSG